MQVSEQRKHTVQGTTIHGNLKGHALHPSTSFISVPLPIPHACSSCPDLFGAPADGWEHSQHEYRFHPALTTHHEVLFSENHIFLFRAVIACKMNTALLYACGLFGYLHMFTPSHRLPILLPFHDHHHSVNSCSRVTDLKHVLTILAVSVRLVLYRTYMAILQVSQQSGTASYYQVGM